jgi:hypothetical protein
MKDVIARWAIAVVANLFPFLDLTVFTHPKHTVCSKRLPMIAEVAVTKS